MPEYFFLQYFSLLIPAAPRTAQFLFNIALEETNQFFNTQTPSLRFPDTAAELCSTEVIRPVQTAQNSLSLPHPRALDAGVLLQIITGSTLSFGYPQPQYLK